METIDDLYDEAFGAEGAQVWAETPALAEPAIHVFIYPPRPTRPFFTLVTGGISDEPLPAPPGREAFRHIELVMYVTPGWTSPDTAADGAERTWLLDLLRGLGRIAHERQIHYRPGDSIPNLTEPPTRYVPSTELAAALILSLPDFDAAFADRLAKAHGVTLLRVVPITAAELALKKAEGSSALLARFREKEVSVAVDSPRASVV